MTRNERMMNQKIGPQANRVWATRLTASTVVSLPHRRGRVVHIGPSSPHIPGGSVHIGAPGEQQQPYNREGGPSILAPPLYRLHRGGLVHTEAPPPTHTTHTRYIPNSYVHPGDYGTQHHNKYSNKPHKYSNESHKYSNESHK